MVWRDWRASRAAAAADKGKRWRRVTLSTPRSSMAKHVGRHGAQPDRVVDMWNNTGRDRRSDLADLQAGIERPAARRWRARS